MILAALMGRQEGFQQPTVFIAFTGALAISWSKTLFIFHKGETEALLLDEAFLVAMALLLPPYEVILAFSIGWLIGYATRRRGLLKTIFNVGISVTAAGLALATVHVISPMTGTIEAIDLAAVVAGAAVFFIVQSGGVSAVIAIAERTSYTSALKEGLGIRLIVWTGNVSVGLLAGLIGNIYPWALAFAAIPVVVLHLVFAGHLSARRDRKRMDGLFETAIKAHASVGIRDIEEAIAESARTLLVCDHVRFDATPPVEGELGVLVDSSNSQKRWLIVSGRRGVEPFDAADHNLLEAIVAIGAAAFENAELFQQAQDEREKLSDVVGSSSDGIFSIDHEGRISSWNPAMESVTGYGADEMLGTRHLGALRPRDSEGADLMIEAWTHATQMLPADIQILTSRGEVRWLNCAFSALKDGGYVAVARDVSAQKQIDELKSEFLATVSHELRTPLTPIQGFLMTLLRTDGEFQEEERRKFYQIMLGQTERLGRLVEDLLDAVAFQGKERKLVPSEVDWPAAVEGLVELVRHEHPEREFTLDVHTKIPSIAADQQRAEQVMSNLLSNAVKYSNPGAPVEVAIESNGAEVVTTVRDHGPGIPLSDRERIFERFTRLGNHMTRKAAGVGLGLYIARQVVEGMKGRIWVESPPGRGAQFRFSLPTYQATLRSLEAPTPISSAGKFGRNGHSRSSHTSRTDTSEADIRRP